MHIICKYLGIDVNTRFDSKAQWDKVHSSIRPNIYLIKQLRRVGLSKQVLFNVYKSLVLSHLRYSSTVLVDCTESTKNEMQVLQNHSLRIIGISREVARIKFSIPDVCEFLEREPITSLSNPRFALACAHRKPAV